MTNSTTRKTPATVIVPPHLVDVLGAYRLPSLLTTSEAAELGNITERRVRDLVYAGDLPAVRIGRSVRIPAAAFLALIELTPARPAPTDRVARDAVTRGRRAR